MSIFKWSQAFHKTYREAPADAEIKSHQLLMRAGMIKKLAPGIYTYGTLVLRSLRKFENIIREELDSIGGQEILMPMVQPKALWEESGRWQTPELLKFKNRNEGDFCLGPTHEEVITDYVRNDVASYRDLPLCIYQVQNKFRDEIRPRFGLMRGREFFMKDAYSFDTNEETAKESYQKLRKAYVRIFDRLGLGYRIVQADGGAIGGSLTEEFQVLAQAGEDVLLVSDKSDFAANREICQRAYLKTEGLKEDFKQEFETAGVNTIADLAKLLDRPEQHLVKTLFLKSRGKKKDRMLVVLLRGNDEFNPFKLKNYLGLDEEPQMLSDEEVESLTGAKPGSCGPQGLSGVEVYADHLLREFPSYLVGANKTGVHVQGLKPEVDFKIKSFADLTYAQAGEPSPDGQGILKEVRGIEVGHIFYLGQKYSKALKATYQDENGKAKPLEMGCYGVGIGRTVQAAVEQSHDDNGIIWPKSLCPYEVHLCVLDPQEEAIASYVKATVSELQSQGLSVFIDDRKERPGVKFKDADLIGLPIRVVIGKRGFDESQVEVVTRYNLEKSACEPGQLVQKITQSLESCP